MKLKKRRKDLNQRFYLRNNKLKFIKLKLLRNFNEDRYSDVEVAMNCLSKI